MPHDVMVSYSTKDQAIGDAVVQHLEARGMQCWISARDVPPGADWTESIMTAVHECGVLIPILTANSSDSPHVKREVQQAVDLRRKLVPLRVGDVRLSRGLAYLVGLDQWLNASNPPTEAQLVKLADAVERVLAGGTLPDGHGRVRRKRWWIPATALPVAAMAGYLLYQFEWKPNRATGQPTSAMVGTDSIRRPNPDSVEATGHLDLATTSEQKTATHRPVSSDSSTSSHKLQTESKPLSSGFGLTTRDTAFGDLNLRFWSDRGSRPTYTEGETLDLSVSASRDCFLYVVSFDASGGFTALLPSRQMAGTNLLSGNRTYRLFRDIGGDFDMLASPPYGQEVVKAFASTVQLGSLLTGTVGSAAGLIAALRRAAAERPIAGRFQQGGRGYAEQSLVVTTVGNGR